MYLAFLLMFLVLPDEGITGKGTTPAIESIFLGRCFELVQLKDESLKGKDCDDLLAKFKAVFNKNTKCTDDYSKVFDEFFKAADPGPMEKDKALFWSGTNSAAHGLSAVNKNYITLEDTLPGYMANDLTFCGEGKAGFNFDKCDCSWDDSQMKSYWKSASKQFALNARGEVSVLVSGTKKLSGRPDDKGEAYRYNCMFATCELPNLNVKEVTKVKILVLMDLDEKRREACGTGSIKKLEDEIEKRKIAVECIDDPWIVQNLLCVQHGNEKNCQRMTKVKYV